MVTLSEGYQEEPMKFTLQAGHINLRETADPENRPGTKTVLSGFRFLLWQCPAKEPGMKNVHVSGQNRRSNLRYYLSERENTGWQQPEY
jgi:hypothetical protein